MKNQIRLIDYIQDIQMYQSYPYYIVDQEQIHDEKKASDIIFQITTLIQSLELDKDSTFYQILNEYDLRAIGLFLSEKRLALEKELKNENN